MHNNQQTKLASILEQAVNLHAAGQVNKARAIYELILAQDGGHVDALHLLGVTEYEKQNYTKAVELISQSLKHNQSYAEAHSNLGNALQRLDRFGEALESYDRAILIKPDFAEAYNNKGNAQIGLMDWAAAVKSFERAIEILPGYAQAYFNKGNALRLNGQYQLAIESYQTALRLQPQYAEAHNNCGNAYRDMLQFKDAVECYKKAVAINPIFYHAYNNCGNAFREMGQSQEAVNCYNKAIELKQDFAQAYVNRGVVLHELAMDEASLEDFERAIALQPGLATAHFSKALLLKDLKKRGQAVQSYQTAISLKPDYFEAHANLGVALKELGLYEAALNSYQRAIQLRPESADVHSNLGNAWKELKQLERANECYEQSIKLSPEFAEAHWNYSLSLLLGGNFEKGLPHYEWRWKRSDAQVKPRKFSQPLWLGDEPILGKTILIYAEQGLGDTIQFARYAKVLSSQGAKVILQVQRSLLPLLSNLPGIHQLLGAGDDLPHFDCHCPLLSLPFATKTSVRSIPNETPYLWAMKEKVKHWSARLGSEGLKIAISWQGSPEGKVDEGRSLALRYFEPIAKLPHVRLISLQKNAGVEQLQQLPPGMNVETLGEDFDAPGQAFLDTAAVIACSDLVITSDTSLTHLAGALGARAWVALKSVPDWRWMLERADSPWYPHHTLFRQPCDGDWVSVFAQMTEQIKVFKKKV